MNLVIAQCVITQMRYIISMHMVIDVVACLLCSIYIYWCHLEVVGHIIIVSSGHSGKLFCYVLVSYARGRIQGVGGGVDAPARASPEIGNNMIFLHKIVIFHTNYLNKFRASLWNWKKYDFLA